MNNLTTVQGTLTLSHVSLQTIAETFGTPCYVYDADNMTANFQKLDHAITVPHRLCYAMKANSNLAILQHLASLGAGFDIVSAGELARALKAGAKPAHIIFSGVGKSVADITLALQAGIGCLNCESIPEIKRINDIALHLKLTAPIALRINPDIQVNTHHHIATGNKEHKFGIAYELLDEALHSVAACKGVRLIGVGCHLGSQLNDIEPYALALDRMITCYQTLLTRGFKPEFIDMGGGMGIDYGHEHALDIAALTHLFNQKIKSLGCQLLLEPGRMMVGPAGLLLTTIEYIKSSHHKRFAIVDAGMNDLIRPAMYDAFHRIIPVTPRTGESHTYDVVGPVCESADYMGKQRTLCIEPGDLLAILDAGAYGSSMGSMYNSRPLIPEVMIIHQQAVCIRQRATVEDLWQHERLLPEGYTP